MKTSTAMERGEACRDEERGERNQRRNTREQSIRGIKGPRDKTLEAFWSCISFLPSFLLPSRTGASQRPSRRNLLSYSRIKVTPVLQERSTSKWIISFDLVPFVSLDQGLIIMAAFLLRFKR